MVHLVWRRPGTYQGQVSYSDICGHGVAQRHSGIDKAHGCLLVSGTGILSVFFLCGPRCCIMSPFRGVAWLRQVAHMPQAANYFIPFVQGKKRGEGRGTVNTKTENVLPLF